MPSRRALQEVAVVSFNDLTGRRVKHNRPRYSNSLTEVAHSFPSSPFIGGGSGLRTGRGARTLLPEGARSVGQTIPSFSPAELLIRSPRQRGPVTRAGR